MVTATVPPATDVDWGRKNVCNPEQPVTLWFWQTVSYEAPISKWRNQSENPLLFDRWLFWGPNTFYILTLLLSLSFQGCSLCFQSLCSFPGSVPQPLCATARAIKIPPKGGFMSAAHKKSVCPVLFQIKLLQMLFLSVLHKLMMLLSIWTYCIIDRWYKEESNSLVAVCPVVYNRFNTYFLLISLREKNKQNWTCSGMQSLSHYSPWNCSSSTYSELYWAVCLCGESPNDSSVGYKGGKMPLKSIQVKSIMAPKDRCKGMMKFPSWQLNAQVDNCKKPEGWKGVPCCEGSAYRERVITWDRCLIDLVHWTLADVLLFHAP